MSTIGQPKKAEKVFIYSLKVPIHYIKIKDGKNLKSEQYIAIFDNILKQVK